MCYSGDQLKLPNKRDVHGARNSVRAWEWFVEDDYMTVCTPLMIYTEDDSYLSQESGSSGANVTVNVNDNF